MLERRSPRLCKDSRKNDKLFPLLHSATGTHSNNDRKSLWCRNVMQIESLLNVEPLSDVLGSASPVRASLGWMLCLN
ncbi:hypothetical protein NQZ68_007422 [Dissostichus eleginoides]|nr:hypothetical protein NQZ68_007422 [Dissostichus eleginoides]